MRQLNSFVDDFAGGCFYLFCCRGFCAARTVGLLRAVIQFFYKFLHHLPLNSGCSSMFRLLIFRAVVSFSNIWNISHLRFASHRETYFCKAAAIPSMIYSAQGSAIELPSAI